MRHSGAGRNGCGSVCSDPQTSPLVILPRTRSRSDPSSPSAHRLRDCPLGRAHRKTPSLPPVHAPTVKQAIFFMRNFLAEEDRGSSLGPVLEKKASKQAGYCAQNGVIEECGVRTRMALKGRVLIPEGALMVLPCIGSLTQVTMQPACRTARIRKGSF